jgi:hypothetical protein
VESAFAKATADRVLVCEASVVAKTAETRQHFFPEWLARGFTISINAWQVFFYIFGKTGFAQLKH